MVKDAEKNILALNQIRARTLAELDEARNQNEVLQGQSKVLTAKLAEADAKLHLTEQTKEKNSILQEQLESLQRKLLEAEKLASEASRLKAKLDELQGNLLSSEAKIEALEALQEENGRLRVEMEGLRAREAELKEKTQDLEAMAAGRRESLDKEVAGLESVASKKEEEIRELREKLRESESQIAGLKLAEGDRAYLEAQVQKLQSDVAILERSEIRILEDYEAERSEIRQDLAEVKSRSAEQANLIQELSNQLSEAALRAEELSETERQNKALAEEIEGLKREILELDGSREEAIGRLLQEKREIEEQAAAAMAAVKENEKVASDLMEQLSDSEARLQELEGIKARNSTLEASIADLQNELSKKEERSASAIAEAKSDCDRLIGQLSIAEEKVLLQEAELENAKGQKEELEKLSAIRSEMEASLASMEEKLSDLSIQAAEKESLKEQVSELMAELELYSSELNLLQKVQEDKAELEREVDELRTAESTSEVLKEQNVQLLADIARLKEDLSEKNGLVERYGAEIKSLRQSEAVDADREQLRATVALLEQEVGKLKATVAQKEGLERELQRMESRLQEMEAVAARRAFLEAEVEKLNVKLSEVQKLKAEKEQLGMEMQRLQKQLQEAGKVAAEKKKLDGEVQKLRAELRTAERVSAEKGALEGTLKALEARLEAILRQKSESEAEIERLQAAVSKAATVQREKVQLEQELARLQSTVQKLEQVEREKAQLEQEVRKLQKNLTHVDQMEREKGRLEIEVQKLRGSFTKAEQLLRDKIRLEQEIQKLQLGVRRLEAVQADKTKVEQQLAVVKASLAKAEQAVKDKSRVEQEVERLTANVQKLEVVRKQKLVLEQEMRGLQASAAKVDQAKKVEILNLKREISELERTATELEKVKGLKSALEAEVGRLQSIVVASGDLEEKNRSLEADLAKLKAAMAGAEKVELEKQRMESEMQRMVESMAAEKSNLENSLKRIAGELADERKKGSTAAARAMKDMEGLKKDNLNLAVKIQELSRKEAQLADVSNRCHALEKEVLSLKEVVEQMKPLKKAAEEVRKKNISLQDSLALLKAKLVESEQQQKLWKAEIAEKEKLKKQVVSLTLQLAESDDMLQSQVELYRSEVEGFQAKLESLVADDRDFQVPVGEMSWDFWSDLMLRLDALMLTKLLTLEETQELRLLGWNRSSRIRDIYAGLQGGADSDVARKFRQLIKGKSRPGLHIVHIAAEMAPVAKVGGLADVVTGLGRALQKKGHFVEVVLPKYDCMDYSRIKDLKVLDFDMPSFFDGELFNNKIWRGTVEGLPVYFIEPHHPAKLFWRNAFYGENDDFRRFTYFCRAALEFIFKAGKEPDIIHSHDWQTAAVAPLYWDIYHPLGLDSAQVVFTCHNFEYQGSENPQALASCGLNVQSLFRQDRMQDNFAMDKINMLKGGFVFSNIITTVSPTYAMEVREPEGGKGLQVTLASCADKFYGVLNGIDFEAWNPLTDDLLPYKYDSRSVDSKYANKTVLREKLGLDLCLDGDKPLVGCITRLVPQKGVHLIRHAIFRAREQGGQFVLLGSSPVPEIQRDFENIARDTANSPDVRLVLKYDEVLSHLIYAACDVFVIPSLFEPCGLTQLIAMRYGAIPVVRKTGGLADSVFDVDDASIPEEKKNGFSFTATDESGLNYALDRALGYYYNHPDWWQDLVVRTMNMDFSWEESSQKYVELYDKAIESSNV